MRDPFAARGEPPHPVLTEALRQPAEVPNQLCGVKCLSLSIFPAMRKAAEQILVVICEGGGASFDHLQPQLIGLRLESLAEVPKVHSVL